MDGSVCGLANAKKLDNNTDNIIRMFKYRGIAPLSISCSIEGLQKLNKLYCDENLIIVYCIHLK